MGKSLLWHLSQEAGADEGIEAEIGLVAAGIRVDGGFGFGFLELCFVAVLPVLERSEIFGRWCVTGMFLGFGRHEDAFGFGTGGFEAKLMLQFFAFCGISLPVARIKNLVGFGLGCSDDFALFVTVILAAMDRAVLGKGAADFMDGVVINYFCHINRVFLLL